MGEMEQLRQEAEQLKKQIAVTQSPPTWGPETTQRPREWGLGAEGLALLLTDTLGASGLEVIRD